MPIEYKNPPKNIAHTQNTIPILAFDEEGNINIFLFDNTETEVRRLGLDASQQIPLSILAKANILFRLAAELRLQPGEDEGQDAEIIKTLKKRISDNILNKDEVAEEIIAAWNALANSPLAKPYRLENETSKTRLIFLASFEMMLHDYIAKYLATLSHFEFIETWLFVQANEIIKSTLEGRAFSDNPYVKMDNLLATVEEFRKDIPNRMQAIDKIKARLKREQGEWYTDLVGLVGLDMDNLLEEDCPEKHESIKAALQTLLAGKYENIHDKDVLGNLADTIRCLKKCLKENDDPKQKAQAILTRQAVESIILRKLKLSGFSIHKKRPNASLIELEEFTSQDEEKLLQTLLEVKESYTPAMLLSIQRKSKDDTIQAVVAEKLKKHKSDPNAVRPI